MGYHHAYLHLEHVAVLPTLPLKLQHKPKQALVIGVRTKNSDLASKSGSSVLRSYTPSTRNDSVVVRGGYLGGRSVSAVTSIT